MYESVFRARPIGSNF